MSQKLPPARISQFGKTSAQIRSPFMEQVGKSTGSSPIEPIYQEGVNISNFLTFTEIFRRSVAEYSRGKILVVANSITGYYADIRIVGLTGKVEEVLVQGSTGIDLIATVGGNSRTDERDLSAPPLMVTWTDDEGFDEIVIYARNMGNGQPTVANTTRGSTVSVAGKMWR